MNQIIAEGLFLRPFDDHDAPAFAQAARESYASVGRWMPWCHRSYSDQEALAWFATCRASRVEQSAFEFGIFSADDGALLGGAGLNQFNQQHAFCNLGYWVRQSRQREAIATRCVNALAHYGFSSLNLHRIEIVVALGNVPSERTALRSGALFECVARNRLVISDVPVAASVFSLVNAMTPV